MPLSFLCGRPNTLHASFHRRNDAGSFSIFLSPLVVIALAFDLAAAFNPTGIVAPSGEGNLTPAGRRKGSERPSAVMGIDDILQQVEAAGDPDAEYQRYVLSRRRNDGGQSSGSGIQEKPGPLEQQGEQDRILFTCTTFLSKPGKRELFEDVMEKLDPVLGDYCARCLIVNEYDEDGGDYSHLVSKYPKFDFYQKSEHQKGQARSLNIILDELEKGGYDYWVQWEEGWKPTQNFLPKALNIMQRTDLDQMQFSQAWLYLPNRKLHEEDGYIRITKTHDDYPEWQCAEKWPLFSLQPGINRAKSILKCGRFDEDPENWPYQFEYLFALEFVKNNLKKGMIKGGASIRVENHLSTHKTAEQKAQEDEERKQAVIAILAQGGSVEDIIRKYQEGEIS